MDIDRIQETKSMENSRPVISLTDAAQNYLRRGRVKNLYIADANIQQCCIPLIAPPVVHKGLPSKPEDFVPIEADGFTVYYEKTLLGPREFAIDLQNYLIGKTLVVKDWRVKI